MRFSPTWRINHTFVSVMASRSELFPLARWLVAAAAMPIACLLCAEASFAQTFVSAGPAPRFGPAYASQTADASPNGTEAGAIQAILPDPALGAGTMFAGSPNGGIWVTADNGATWKALTDNQASLSIASLGLDPTDKTGKTIIAGVGITDNGEYSYFNQTAPTGSGGVARSGILYTTNGGATWSALGPSLIGQSVIGVEARGSVIMAATFEELTPRANTAGYGLYRSTDGGATFSLVPTSTGLPAGAVTSLVADPSNQSRFYAAVRNSANNAATAVYVSNDMGATWQPLFTSANSNNQINSSVHTTITLAAGPNGSVAVAVSNLDAPRALTGVFLLSGNQGATWNQLTAAPNVVAGSQTPINLHIAIDPSNANIAYLSGDRYNTCTTSPPPTSLCSVQAFRLNYNPSNNSSTATSLTFEGTLANNFLDANTVHADSRAMAFDTSGNLILTSDGGIYLRNNPHGNGTWQGLNGNLSVFESYQVAFDANSKRVAVASQDNGASLQSAPGSPLFNAINLGDGTNVAINDRTLSGLSAIYSTTANLGLTRMIVNAQGQVVNPIQDPLNNVTGVPVTCGGGASCGSSSFAAPFVLNRVDPTMIALGGSFEVDITRDSLTGPSNGVNAKSVDLTLTKLGSTPGLSVITYGTVDNPQAIAVGASVNGVASGGAGQVWYDTTNTAGSLTKLLSYNGEVPTSMVFDNRSQSRLFVADSFAVYYTQNANTAATFAQLGLPPSLNNFTRPTSVEFISTNGVNTLLVGGLNTPQTCTTGRLAPNGCVISPSQSPIIVADSDTNGALSGWRYFGQSLPNALVYQMAFNAAVDVLAVSSIGRGAWLLYDVTSNFPQASVLQFGLANNNSNPDAALLTDGTVGTRPLIKYGTGTLTITGDATYSGSTTVNGGILEVDGTISHTSSVAVNSTGILTGVGTVDPLVVTINSGGTLAPGAAGSPGTSLTIVGNLALQSGAFYLVQINATTSTFVNVTGTASLGGTALAVFTPGMGLPAHQYMVLQSAGLNGTFAAVAMQNLANFTVSLGYTANNVLLNLTAALGAGSGLNGNQQSVANPLNSIYNNGGTLPANFATVFGLTGPTLANTLSQLSGEVAADADHGAFQMMTQFLGLMLDPFVDGRLGSGNGQAMGFAPVEQTSLPPDIALAYAAILKKAPAQPTFDQRWTAWGAAYGGSNTTNGDPAAGSSNLTATTFGFAGGMDYHLSPNTIVGFALAGGGLSWGLATGGTGRSDALQTGVYGVTHAGPAYLAGAFAFTNHWFTTSRSVLGDQLNANFAGQSYGARLEGGYRYAVLPSLGVTPYGALQAQAFHTPSYSETDASGGGFGLNFAAMNASDVRIELGTRLDHPMLVAGMPLIIRGRLAWAHDFVSNPALGAVFQTLPGSNFTVNGAPIPHDSALASAGAELFLGYNWTLLAKFDGEFAAGSQSYAGTGTLRYTW